MSVSATDATSNSRANVGAQRRSQPIASLVFFLLTTAASAQLQTLKFAPSPPDNPLRGLVVRLPKNVMREAGSAVRTSNYDAWSAQRTLPLATRHLSVDAPLVLVPYSGDKRDKFPHSLEFNYVPLSELMTGMNQFTWEPLERLLNDIASRGTRRCFKRAKRASRSPSATPVSRHSTTTGRSKSVPSIDRRSAGREACHHHPCREPTQEWASTAVRERRPGKQQGRLAPHQPVGSAVRTTP